MKAGALRERITIEKEIKETVGGNQKVPKWVPHCEVWAEARCTSSTLIDSDGFTVHAAVWKFFIRRRDDIAASMRVVWKGRIFQLQGPPVDWTNERNGLTLIAKEVM